MNTNCSERLGSTWPRDRTGTNFAVVVTALNAPAFTSRILYPTGSPSTRWVCSPKRCLFVAGSPYDLFGTSKLDLPAYWHDRIGMTAPRDVPTPMWHEKTLTPLLDVLGLAAPRSSGIRGCFLPRAQSRRFQRGAFDKLHRERRCAARLLHRRLHRSVGDRRRPCCCCTRRWAVPSAITPGCRRSLAITGSCAWIYAATAPRKSHRPTGH